MQDEKGEEMQRISLGPSIAKQNKAMERIMNRPVFTALDIKKRTSTLTARVERLEAALLNIYQVWQIRSELFTNDEDCAASLADRARAAFGDATSHPPQQPEPQTGLSEG